MALPPVLIVPLAYKLVAPILCPLNNPPTYNAPPIPAPPPTINAPVAVLVLVVVFVIDKLPNCTLLDTAKLPPVTVNVANNGL